MKYPTSSTLAVTLLGLSAVGCAEAKAEAPRPKQNVLFIIVDDLRTELGCYGHDVISPNIDALAKSGVQFNQSYCNIPVSGATRASLLSGTRPTRNTFITARTNLTLEKPDAIGINEHFQNAGYTTVSEGKVFDNVHDREGGWDRLHRNTGPVLINQELLALAKSHGKRGFAYECTEGPDSIYFDGRNAELALRELEDLAKSDKPFFYALGFSKPHLPFASPKKYWDMYDYDKITVPDNFIMPDGHGIPDAMFAKFGELFAYYGVGEKGEQMPVDTARRLIHGYRAAVSYIDAQVGKVVAKLKETGLDKNTAIVLVGDHGWNLGEHGGWCKHCMFNTSINTPMIIVDPASKLKGRTTDEVVEYVDIFPTLCELAGIESHEQVEGESLLPLLNDKKAKHKGYAITRWGNGCTIITNEGLHYSEWWDYDDNVINRNLFNHKLDPLENKNLVDEPEYAEVVKELSKELMAKRGKNFDKYQKRYDKYGKQIGPRTGKPL